MKILHTSDWHLGKNLEKFSRLYEQENFLKELLAISDEENVDAIVVAGDVYDSFNPPAAAEQLFYFYARELTKGGLRPLVVIPGNHDNPERLSASAPLAMDSGIIIVESINSVIPLGNCGKFKIIKSQEGYFEIDLYGKTLSVIAVPFISEKRIGRILTEKASESEIKEKTNTLLKEHLETLSKNFSENSANIMIGHFFLAGGITSDSEKIIQFGGSSAISPSVLPEKAHYIAMGHLHRPQKIPYKANAYYSGSPIDYSLSETAVKKKVYIADISDECVSVSSRLLSCLFPLKKIRGTYPDVLSSLENLGDNFYAYLEIETTEHLTNLERKALFNTNSRIVEISILGKTEYEKNEEIVTKSFEEEFCDFFEYKNGFRPGKDVIELFLSIVGEGGNETS